MDQKSLPARDHRLAAILAVNAFLVLATVGFVVFAVLWQWSDGELFGGEERQWSTLAPAFSAEDLSAEPTNGQTDRRAGSRAVSGVRRPTRPVIQAAGNAGDKRRSPAVAVRVYAG